MADTNITGDLNQVIASAVQARIESEVATALSGSDLMAQYVTAALQQPISVRENYRDRQTTYLAETIKKAIQEATKAAVAKVVAKEAPKIEKLVREKMRERLDALTDQMVTSVIDKAASPYGISVELRYPSNGDD
jgi:hypothetical protein